MPSGAFARLAGLVGMAGSVDDEHWRWRVYQAACDRPDARDLLLEATLAEPDGLLAVGIAYAMVEREGCDDAPSWVDAVPPPDRDRVAARAADVARLRTVQRPGTAASDDEVASWSDWLQRRVASTSASTDVLRALELEGRYRRIRGAARERLTVLSREP